MVPLTYPVPKVPADRSSSVQRSRRRHTARLRVEALEDRSLLSGIVSLAPSDDSPLVGERVTWTATATDVGATPVYQFSAAPHGGAFHVVRDFSPANTFAWTPMQEGTYDIEVTVKDGYQATETTSAVVADEVASRVTGSQAVVTPTAQPARGPVQRPAVVGGDGVRPVRRGGRPPGLAEHRHARRRAGEEHERLRGGHAAQHDLRDAARVQRRHRLRARALHDGEHPRDADLPRLHRAATARSRERPRSGHGLPSARPGPPQHPAARGDRPPGAGGVVLRPLRSRASPSPRRARVSCRGARCCSTASIATRPCRTAPNVLREIDLAGNPVRETNLAAVNAQLAALGHEPIHAFHHDVQRLPDGTTVVLALIRSAPSTSTAPPPITSAKWSWCSTRTSR